MSDEAPKRLLITPPPGLLPPVPATDHASDESGKADTGSATRRIASPRSPAPVFFPAPPGSPAPAAAPVSSDDAAPAAPAETPVPHEPVPEPQPGSGEWQVVLADGSRHPVPEGGLVLGRNPTPPRTRATASPLAVDDPEKTVSKSHAVLIPAGDDLTVIDLKSTNGTAVVDSEGHHEVLDPVTVHREARVVLGSLSLEVTRA